MKIILPEISGRSESATITLWYAKEGERVQPDQDIAEVVTDKATFDIPSPCGGILSKIVKKKGDSVAPGEVLGEIEYRGEA